MDRKWMKRALELAEAAAANGEVPVGAVIVLNGEKIAEAQNRIEELNTATAHAEILAINEAGKNLKNWRLDGATIYVSLEPCPMCFAAIKNCRISRVVFAARSLDTGPIIENGLFEAESVEILQNFFRRVRKKQKDYES